MNLQTWDQRILRGVPATLSWQYEDENGVAADPGVVTIGVTTADGTVVVNPGHATGGSSTAPRTLALPAIATLELLTATWTTTGGAFTTLINVVGGFYFSNAEARAIETSLSDGTKYPDADIARVRREVEDEFEEIADASFVPQYRRIRIDGSGTPDLVLSGNRLRTVRTIRVYSSATAYTSFTAGELADLSYDDDLTIHRPAGIVFDDARRANTVVEYELGFDRPPSDLKRAMIRRLRSRLNMAKSDIPDRAERWQPTSQGTLYMLSKAGPYTTGINEIDAVYERYSKRSQQSGTPVPASQSLVMSPQRYSVFHGARR